MALQSFHSEMINLLTCSLESSRTPIVQAAASVLFNLSQLFLREGTIPGDDDLICIIVSVVELLRVSVQNGSVGNDELARLLVVCLGGMIIVAQGSMNSIGPLLVSLEVPDLLLKVSAKKEGAEVLDLLD